MQGPGVLTRCLAVELVATVTCALGAHALGQDALASTTGLPGLDADRAVVVLCELVLVACLGWAWAATTAVVLDLVRGHQPTRPTPGVPQTWRRWVLAACGAALAVGVVVPAQATPGGVHLDPTGHRADALLAGLPMPERAVGPAPVAPVTRARRVDQVSRPATPAPGAVPGRGEVTVGDGDSLWAIAARTLPADAGEGDVADRWHAIYRANQVLLGPDPDLISPGQHLTVPPL